MQVNSDLYSSKLLWPYLQFTAAMYPEKRGILQDCAVIFFCNWRLCTEAATGSMLLQKSVLKIFTKFSGKHQCQSLTFDEVTGLGSANLFKKILWHRCFQKNISTRLLLFLINFSNIEQNKREYSRQISTMINEKHLEPKYSALYPEIKR